VTVIRQQKNVPNLRLQPTDRLRGLRAEVTCQHRRWLKRLPLWDKILPVGFCHLIAQLTHRNQGNLWEAMVWDNCQGIAIAQGSRRRRSLPIFSPLATSFPWGLVSTLRGWGLAMRWDCRRWEGMGKGDRI
jgi:hypothetical protein